MMKCNEGVIQQNINVLQQKTLTEAVILVIVEVNLINNPNLG